MDALPSARLRRPHPQRLVGTPRPRASCNPPGSSGRDRGRSLDPSYSDEVRQGGLYAVDSGTVADDVRAWCEANGDNPRYRIVLAGYDTEHAALEARGWRSVEWFRGGFPEGRYGQPEQVRGQGTQQHRERLVLSPLPRRQGRRRRWICLPDLHRRRQVDGMILTGPAIRAAIARGDITITP